MSVKSTTVKILVLLFFGAGTFAQTSLKFENGGGPSGSGPSATPKTVTMYRGDAGVYSPATTVTYSLSNQQYASVEGNSGVGGMVFGADISSNSNTVPGRMLYQAMNALSGSQNSHYSTDGATPPINVVNDYGVGMTTLADALITNAGANRIPTNSKNVYFGDLIITFNRPVTDPILHLTGLGGFYQASSGSGSLGLSTSFELTDDYTISRLSGNPFFQVGSGKTIYNSAARYTSATNNSSPSAASGSVKINGSGITSLTFRVLMNGDGNGSSPWSSTGSVNGDAFLMSVSLNTYDVSGTVFNDNNNGTPDGIGYGGVTVTLYDENNNVVGTTTTDNNGNYIFNGVLQGNYRVVITTPDGFENVGSSEGDKDGSTAISVSNQNATGVNFGINEPPVASDDQKLDQPAGSPVTVSLLDNDSDPNGGTLDPEKISLIAPESATDVTTDGDGHVTGFTVPGEGTWIRNDDGTLTFTPESGFTGNPAPIRYTVTDEAGLTSDPATVTITYIPPVTVSGTVYNDNNGGTPDGTLYEGATVTLYDNAGNIVATTTTDADGNYTFENVVPGDYTVRITSPDGYEVVGSSEGDTDGSTPITVGSEAITGIDFGINQPPVANDDEKLDQPAGSAVTVDLLDNDSDPNGGTLDPEKISLIAPEGAADVTTDGDGHVTGFTVPGEGTWTRNDDGTLTFTPESGFTGNPAPIRYTATDEAGLTSEPATVTITYVQGPPVPSNDMSGGNKHGSDATVNILENDTLSDGSPATPDNTTVTLTTEGLPEGSSVSGNTVTVPGEGTWTYDPATGDITFSPQEGFKSDPTRLTYTLTENATGLSENATVTMVYESLPVKLVWFTATRAEGSVVLNWATSGEVNFEQFKIERSRDGRIFSDIGMVTGKGTGSLYNFTDAGAEKGNNYYRLRMLDKDGSYEYSGIVNGVVSRSNAVVTVYPNPATDFVTITGLKGGEIVYVTNLYGTRLHKIQVTGTTCRFDVRGLVSGVYTIFIEKPATGSIHTTHKIIKE